MRVRSAPFRPGASPINMIFASSLPLSWLRTALRPHILSQRVHVEALLTSSSQLVVRDTIGPASIRRDVNFPLTPRPPGYRVRAHLLAVPRDDRTKHDP